MDDQITGPFMLIPYWLSLAFHAASAFWGFEGAIDVPSVVMRVSACSIAYDGGKIGPVTNAAP
eukprot:6209020-Pleurochrysis_carterae.AAC.1